MDTRMILSTRDMTRCALMAVMIAVCSWISIPIGPVPFTLQTLGVFCALGMLGGMRGMISIVLYVLLGAVGVPVFAGFAGGVGTLLGPSGGYIMGFVLSAAVYWLITAHTGSSVVWQSIAMALGLIVCYAFGTFWFMRVYAANSQPVTLGAALGWCVFPFILPDAVKIAMAQLLSRRIRAHVHM